MDIYSSRVLELSTNIKNINNPIDKENGFYGEALKVSKICGSQIALQLIIDPQTNEIINFSIDPKACALGQASAAILSQNIIGAKIEEIIKARDDLKHMLKEDGPLPQGRFWELRYLEAVKDYKPRHTSTLLAWEAAVEAIEMAQKQDF